ncbi:hypothetical protein BDR03DRAFT_938556 [Suillus americanus]|nr:hypothetical protein BDR03DRAFT_938556 [Suillus americanus]
MLSAVLHVGHDRIRHPLRSLFLEAVDCNSDPPLLSYFLLLQYPSSSYSSVSATHYYY